MNQIIINLNNPAHISVACIIILLLLVAGGLVTENRGLEWIGILIGFLSAACLIIGIACLMYNAL